MSIHLRKSNERGFFDHGWLKTYHTFSFGQYYDPAQMGFKHLRVINEDMVGPSTGFPEHPHKDMEIITIILSGTLSHRDSTGVVHQIKKDDIQFMTAGVGITHSEYNGDPKEPVYFLQIWIIPSEKSLEPFYKDAHFPESNRKNQLQPIVSPDGKDGSLTIHQNVRLFRIDLENDTTFFYTLAPAHSAWIQVISGSLLLNEIPLSRGDGLSAEAIKELKLTATSNTSLLIFDLF